MRRAYVLRKMIFIHFVVKEWGFEEYCSRIDVMRSSYIFNVTFDILKKIVILISFHLYLSIYWFLFVLFCIIRFIFLYIFDIILSIFKRSNFVLLFSFVFKYLLTSFSTYFISSYIISSIFLYICIFIYFSHIIYISNNNLW